MALHMDPEVRKQIIDLVLEMKVHVQSMIDTIHTLKSDQPKTAPMLPQPQKTRLEEPNLKKITKEPQRNFVEHLVSEKPGAASDEFESLKDKIVDGDHRFNGFKVDRGYYKSRRKKFRKKNIGVSDVPDLRAAARFPRRQLEVKSKGTKKRHVDAKKATRRGFIQTFKSHGMFIGSSSVRDRGEARRFPSRGKAMRNKATLLVMKDSVGRGAGVGLTSPRPQAVLFDKMTQSGKRVTKKRKKKRWKEIAKRNKTTGVKRKIHNRQMFNRWLLWSLTEKKKRANWEHEKKGIKHNKYSHHLVYAKLFVVHTTILKKLARWKKHRFKRKQKISVSGAGNQTVFPWEKKRATRKRKKTKHNKQKEKIKATLLRKQIVNLWNLKLEPELFRKDFNGWFKKTHSYEGAYMRDDRFLQPSGLVMQNGEKIKPTLQTIRNDIWFSGERNTLIHQVIIVVSISGVETTKKKMLWTSGKRRRFRHRHKKKKSQIWNNVNCRQMLDQVPLLRIKGDIWKENTKEVAQDLFCWFKMLCLPGVARNGKMIKNFCSFLTHIPENQIGKIASVLIDVVKHSDFGAVRRGGRGKNVELILKDCSVIADSLPLELDNADAILGMQWLETFENIEGKGKEYGLQVEHMEIHTPPPAELLSELFIPIPQTAIQLDEFCIEVDRDNSCKKSSTIGTPRFLYCTKKIFLQRRAASGQVGEQFPKTNDITKKPQRKSAMLAQFRNHSHQASQCFKAHTGQHRHEVQFETGNWVFLMMQSSWAHRLHEKLPLRLYRLCTKAWDNSKADSAELLVKWRVLRENTKLLATQFLHFNLEDKVDFKGRSIDTYGASREPEETRPKKKEAHKQVTT